MAKFLNTTQSRGEMEGILTNARNSVVIISPYIKINEDFISRLNDAAIRRKIKIRLVCRENKLRSEEYSKILQIPNLELFFNDRVHAKCFYNESCMVITSLNLYDSSLGDNREMGVLLNKLEDKQAFNDAENEATFIMGESIKAQNIVTSKPKSEHKTKIDKIGTNGHCIRCNGTIVLDINAPYCPDCYKVWKRYKDEEYEEKYCHVCGEPSESSMKYPLCDLCYKEAKKAMFYK
jgi:hypothetical protein